MIQKFTEEKKKYIPLLIRFLKELDLYSESHKIFKNNFETNSIGNFGFSILARSGIQKKFIGDVIWNAGLLKKTKHYIHTYYTQSMREIESYYGLEFSRKFAEDVNRDDFSVADISKYKKYFV